MRPMMLGVDVLEQIEVARATLPVLDPVDDAVHPVGAFAASALAARFFIVEEGQALERLDHTGRLVHHDDSAGTET